MRKIPFLNLGKLFELHRAEFMTAIEGVVSQSHFIGGSELEKFEKNFAQWVGKEYYCAGCANGTDAIVLAAKALNLPPGSEAIIPAMTFVATAEGLLHAGLKLKVVDVAPGTWLMDTKALEKAIGPQTKLIVPVYLYGQMPAMDEIKAIADRHGCRVLEDAAQAHGATWKGKPPGYYGDLATFSFFPGKNLGAFGDAGAVVSKNKGLLDSVYAFGKHGGHRKYEHNFVGYNSRLDSLQAAVLSVKLKYISEWNETRTRMAGLYAKALKGAPDLEIPQIHPDAQSSFHLYVVLTKDRQALQNHLKERGVETGIHYPLALHQLPAFKEADFARASFPNAERVARHGLSLPMCPTMTEADVAYVVEAVWEYANKKNPVLHRGLGNNSLTREAGSA